MSDAPSTVRPTRRWLRFGAAAGVGGALLAWAFHDIVVEDVLETLRGARWGWLLAALLLDLAVILGRSIKWRCLLPQAPGLRQRDVFSATGIGLMLNNVLPVRLDEPFRAWLLSRNSGLPAPTLFGTIVLERLWDGAVLLAILAALTTWLTLPDAMSAAGLIASLIVAALLALAGVALAMGDSRVGRLAVVRSFREGLAAPRGARGWLAPPLLCALEWALSVAFLICIARALGIALPAQLTLVIQTAHNISFAFAVLPGGIGLMETLDRALLTSWGEMSTAEMLGFMMLSRVMLSAPVTLLGLLLLQREGLRLSSVTAAAELPRRADAASL